ncbi:N-formyl-4-amino-5-aminomethyl-2-methylpyrimidine deformylase [Sulfitobacter indolifex]|uniref:Acetylornithine deacetylase n=1 Tax=Sulfitobacter indolifex HEL-45 TaxID=391624 RepID=A0ABM9X8L8_9RHOB|nr:ArgE/DapE family deacylase [Sulfitobacter indolifex]EDQ05626.1 acetylornithine deacetylase [Sulfitobacter indolifex HEL-45]UOA19799.1 N-formyl-4-amino-5-aminomethyl-2-methylpyrimidine deformylase [Sulfitobacter indolifex]
MTLDPDLKSRILQAVEDGFAEQVSFTQQLVQTPSQRGQEHAIQDLLFRGLQSRGYAMDRFKMDRAAIEAHPGGSKYSDDHSDAPIVVGIHRPRDETGRSLILQSHLDVVPEGLHDMWDDPPLSAKIDGDWMYGRGAGDMKAGAAANIFALDALRRIGLQPAATVYVQSVVEEESTGNGALQTFLQGYTADAVFIPEPEEEMLVRTNTGVIWFQVQVRGVPVHVREMGEGANAIDAATRVMTALREMEEDWNAEKGEHPHFEDEAHPINLNIGKIEGGDWASSVPSWCNIDCRVSIYPGRSAEDAAREITERVKAFAQTDSFLSNNPPEVVFNGFHAEGYVLEPGSDAEAVLERAHESAIGAPLQSFMTAGYLDTRVYALYNKIPALCYGPKSRNIHGINESVSLSSVKKITQAMALFIAEWCGTEDITP